MESFWIGGSVVERVPDKNEVQGSIPCAPTKIGPIDSTSDLSYNPSYL